MPNPHSQVPTVFVLALVAVAVLTRLLPHPPNFSPVAAIALFAGASVSVRWLRYAVPLFVLALSDLYLGLHATLPAVYAGMLLVVPLGRWVCRRTSAGRVAAGALGGATVFFLVSNLGVWLVGGLYPLTAEGLASCFAMAIPFFQNTLASTLLYSVALFGAWSLIQQQLPETAGAQT